MASIIEHPESSSMPLFTATKNVIMSTKYDWQACNSLLHLGQAREIFEKVDAIETITGPIRDIFLQHEAHHEFALTLLHTHFQIKSDQRLVDCRSVATPWIFKDDNAVVHKYGRYVYPKAYRLANGKFEPYEFEFSHDLPHFQPNQTFLTALASFLHHRQLDGILGLRVLGKDDPDLNVEATEGTTNVMVHKSNLPEESLVPTLWVFGNGTNTGTQCVGFCMYDSASRHSGFTHQELD